MLMWPHQQNGALHTPFWRLHQIEPQKWCPVGPDPGVPAVLKIEKKLEIVSFSHLRVPAGPARQGYIFVATNIASFWRPFWMFVKALFGALSVPFQYPFCRYCDKINVAVV